MAKLPVKLLLYSLYAGATALFGGIGWTFYETYQLQQQASKPAYQAQIIKDMDDLLKAGRNLQPERRTWRYGTAQSAWWQQFAKVNIIGKVEVPKVEETTPVVEAKAPEDTGVPISDIVVIESLMLEASASETAEKVTHVVLRYRPEAGVQPPPDAAPPPAPGGRAWSPGDATRPQPTGGTVPLAGALPNELRQVVRLEETLWPPYANIRLVGVAPDAQSAYFVREDPKKDKANWKQEEVFKNSLDLDQEVVKLLRADLRPGAGDGTEARPVQPVVTPSQWQDVAETGEVSPGNVHVSRKDFERYGAEFDRVLNEDVAVSTYKARVGNYEGLRVERVSGQLASFGVRAGDVILSVNGEAVKNKAQAYNVGRRQYESGTRRFVAEILTGRGELQTRTITLPDK